MNQIKTVTIFSIVIVVLLGVVIFALRDNLFPASAEETPSK